ncbi:MAG: carboxymuconolactone decarboxylase family protein [Chloroflexi bacterium]|nr:carboxymuconolactone decarboxylase family protein [Chloroflexota bacterium]
MTINNPSERLKRGLDLMAEASIDRSGLDGMAASDDRVGPEVARMLGEFCFGDVWTHGSMDNRTKRIVTLATISALGRERQLRGHIDGALDQGFTREEVLDIFVHQIAYGGFPMGLSGMQVAAEVFAERDAKAADA